MAQSLEFGLDTFGDVTAGPDGQPQAQAQVIREVIEQAVLADQVGIDAFGVGEHHRSDFAISAPEVVLAAIASRTNRIVLGSAGTLVFGVDLAQYEDLFEEKLDLFAALLKQEPVTWQGQLRPPLKNQRVFPLLEKPPLKTWIGVGGSPQSVVRAAHSDLPLMLAIIGGDPRRFMPFIDLYKRAYEQLGRPIKPIGLHSHGYVADTDAQGREELWPHHKA